jgi:hypothetical protein
MHSCRKILKIMSHDYKSGIVWGKPVGGRRGKGEGASGGYGVNIIEVHICMYKK